ncbi:hypothetical protein [Lacibacter sp. H407]|uniref:hypothetical protein n=1 Tax=Lacibacter sp. H407 TaxID=3133423 RepID=UPI0030BDF50F
MQKIRNPAGDVKVEQKFAWQMKTGRLYRSCGLFANMLPQPDVAQKVALILL